jgi:hypothetical protein
LYHEERPVGEDNGSYAIARPAGVVKLGGADRESSLYRDYRLDTVQRCRIVLFTGGIV